MQKITKEEKLFSVLAKWKKQYNGSTNIYDTETTQKLAKLSLSELSVDKVNQIIGNDGWTRLECYQCGQNVETLIKFQFMDYEGQPEICEKCLERALHVLRGY